MTRNPDDRIQIWYIIGTLEVGGTERTLVDLVNGLDRNRFAPTVWTIADPGPLASEIVDDVPVRSLGGANKLDPRPLYKLGQVLRRDRPAVLQAFLYFDNVLARLVGQVSPGTTVVTGVRSVPDSLPVHRNLIDQVTISLSDHVVSNSEAGAEWVIDRGIDPNRVSVIRNGRDVKAFDVPEPDGLRKSLDVGEGPVVGTVGRLVELKGHQDLIQAWPSVKNRHPQAQLVIVGDGPEYERLESEAERLGVDSCVHLIGRRDDIPELLALFDVFAFPSRVEGLSGALLEAMCAELPIVTTPAGGNSELVTDGEHGLHAPTRNPEAIAREVSHLLSEAELATVLAENAGKRAREQFSLDVMVAEFETLYELSR